MMDSQRARVPFRVTTARTSDAKYRGIEKGIFDTGMSEKMLLVDDYELDISLVAFLSFHLLIHS